MLQFFILSSIAIISFYILFSRFFLKRKELSDARVVSVTKNEYGFAVHFFVKIHKFLKVNIWLMIKRDLSKLSFVRNFHHKAVRRIYSNVF